MLRESGIQTGKFSLTYYPGGKCYKFSASSVHALAERLNLIPGGEIDYWVESRKAIQALSKGEKFESLGGLFDTIRFIISEKNGNFADLKTSESKDKYDRTVYIFESMTIYPSYEEYAKVKGW
jgi:hypothetical protein